MSAAFDPAALMQAVRAATRPGPVATSATIATNPTNCRNVAIVARPDDEPLPLNCRNVAIVATGGNNYLAKLRGDLVDMPLPDDWESVAIVATVAGGDASDASINLARCSPESFDLRWWDNSDEAVAERAALCAETCPSIYLDTWARLNCQKPMRVSHDDWRAAINDAGLFLDQWGAEAAEIGWRVGELFDVPRPGKSGGLIWRLRGFRVERFGTNFARLSNGRLIDRKALS